MSLPRIAARKFEFGDNSTALLHFALLLDPLSEAAQKYSSLIEVSVPRHIYILPDLMHAQWALNDPTVFVELHINPPRYKDVRTSHAILFGGTQDCTIVATEALLPL